MSRLGGAMFFFGIGSSILHFLEREFVILMWIDSWGSGVAWLIRIALIVGGGFLWVAGRNQE